MIFRMRLTSLLFLGWFLVGCSSETTGPGVSIDAANNDDGVVDSAVAKDDTAIAKDDTSPPGDDTATPPGDAPSAGATFNDVYTTVLKGSCSSSYCHGSTAGGWSVKADAASTYAQLVDMASSACSGLKKVEPGQPEKSSLYLKLRGSFDGVCTGQKMPAGGSITATQLETVRSWIAAGAKP